MTVIGLDQGNAPLLRPTPTELAVAPELGVLATLDATLATAAYQLLAANPSSVSTLSRAVSCPHPSPVGPASSSSASTTGAR